MSADPFNLQRFVEAQAPVWDDVCAELQAGKKRTHWMWFVFPQLVSLGRSTLAKFYGISGAEEAVAYLAHPVPGPRLLASCEVLMKHGGMSAEQILGAVDATKLRSCLTLFDAVASGQPLFSDCIDRFFAGERDGLTLAALKV